MYILSKVFFPLAFFILMVPLSYSQDKLDIRIDSIMSAYAGNNSPGCAITVIQNKEVTFSRGYGLAHMELNIPIQPETVTDIGSTAKQFTCMAIHLLKEDGKLNLDDNLDEFFSDIPDFAKSITIENLMNHTSGIREVYTMLAFEGNRQGDGIKQRDALRILRNSTGLNFEPGSAYMYCNTAYIILADIIEKVSEMSYEDYLREHIFIPLDMQHTYVMDQYGELFQNCADSYSIIQGKYIEIFDNSTAYGQGGIYSTSGDMVKWMNNYFEPKVGTDATMKAMTKKAILNDGEVLEYASGLRVADRFGIASIGHGGASAGFRTFFELYPDHNLGIIIKSNVPGINFNNIIRLILETQLPGKVMYMENAPNKLEEKEHLAFSDNKIKAVIGKYYCKDADQNYYLTYEDGKLYFSHHRHERMALTAISDNAMKSEDGYISKLEFMENEKGDISGFKLNASRVLNLYFSKIN